MTIYEKLLKIMSDVPYLKKDGKVDYSSNKYRFLSESKVTTIMRDRLLDYGLIVFPIKQDIVKEGNVTTLNVVYKMVDTETGESIEIASSGQGSDTQDKGAGKAMTNAFKYMWLRTFAIPTGEDPDDYSSDELTDKYAEEEKKAADDKEKIKDQILQLVGGDIDLANTLAKRKYGQEATYDHPRMTVQNLKDLKVFVAQYQNQIAKQNAKQAPIPNVRITK